MPGPHLVLLANLGAAPTDAPCALCGDTVLPGMFLPALAYSARRAGFTCPRCATQVDPVVAEIARCLNTLDALIDGLTDPQHRSGLAHGLSLLIGRITAPTPEGDPSCRVSAPGAEPPPPSSPNP